jgi:hypothetical protein
MTTTMRKRARKILLASTLALLPGACAPGGFTGSQLPQEATVSVQGPPQQVGGPQATIPPDFAFEGLSFNTTSREFRANHAGYSLWEMAPFCREGPETNKKTGIEQYVVTGMRAANKLVADFHHGKLYWMRIIYDVDDVNRIGGDRVLHERLVQKYGAPTTVGDTGFSIWELGNTYIKLDNGGPSGGPWTLLDVVDVARSALAQEAQARQAGLDTGF